MAKTSQALQTGATTASRSLTSLLVRRILGGVYPASEKLPTERDMSGEFGVSRHVVREALKRMEALGLVRIQQGSGTYVSNALVNGGVELFEYVLIDENDRLDINLLKDFMTFWAHFLPEVFRLVALERTDEELNQIKRVLAERAEAQNDPDRLNEVNQELNLVLAQSTHNAIYHRMFNNLGRILIKLRTHPDLKNLVPEASQERLELLVDAIENRDTEMASLLARRLTDTMRASISGLAEVGGE